MNPELIKTNILDKQHQLLAVDFGAEWLTYLQEQADTKQGEDKSDLLAGECSYQPEWLEQKDWIKYLWSTILKYLNFCIFWYSYRFFSKFRHK